MRTLLLGMLCFLFVIAASPAGAAPSVNGSTGLINIPSADVLHEGQFAVGYYQLKDSRSGVFSTNFGTNIEIGVAGFHFDNASNKTFVNAKYALLPERVLNPGIAVGIEDIGDRDSRTAYVAVSKGLPLGFRLHAGFGNGRYGGMFAAIEKTFNPVRVIDSKNGFPTTTLIVETDSHHTNFDARMSVVSGLKVDVGWREHNFFFGLNFTN